MVTKCANCGKENLQPCNYCDTCGINFHLSPPFESLGEALPQSAIIHRLQSYMGIPDYKVLNQFIRFTFFVVAVGLGILTSPWGHIYTTGWNFMPLATYVPPLYLFIFCVSYISPRLALHCAILFCLSDLVQKLVIDDVYYPGGRTISDYLLARMGYLFSYISVFIAAVLPGFLARVFYYHGLKPTVALFRRVLARAGASAKIRRPAHGTK